MDIKNKDVHFQLHKNKKKRRRGRVAGFNYETHYDSVILGWRHM